MSAARSVNIAAPAPLEGIRDHLLERAWAHVDEARLRAWAVALVDVASPTGDEAALARVIAERLTAAGVDARTQPLDERQANAVARLPGTGAGTDLLLYAPIDTVTAGDPAEDVPAVGPALRPDLRPEALVEGDFVVGLGAGNPKGHAACVAAAIEAVGAAVAATGHQLPGNLAAGFGAGGMPTNARPGARPGSGQGIGCSFMLEQGTYPDEAVIAKPGMGVQHEEVGLAWFALRVAGTHTYVGSRHLLPYRNPITVAAELIAPLERWAADYTRRHTSGAVAPQVSIGAISSGWPRTASFTGAVCELLIDVRLSPRTTPAAAQRELRAFLAERYAADPELDASVEMTLSVPGTTTPPDHPVIATTIAAWERQAGIEHVAPTAMSGATDANILRGRGVPTARVGMPKATAYPEPLDFALGMNLVHVPAMARLTRLLAEVAIDRCCTPAPDQSDDSQETR